MIRSIASHFIAELDDTDNLLHFRQDELSGLSEQLNELIRYNTVMQLAAKVEHYQNQVRLLEQNANLLENKSGRLRISLNEKEVPVPNEQVNADKEADMQELRNAVYLFERQIAEVRFQCYQFLCETVILQARKGQNNSHIPGNHE